MIRRTIFITCLVLFLLLLVYGSVLSSYRVYETDMPEGARVALFDLVKESRLMAVSTFEGVIRDEQGRLHGDFESWLQKKKKPCPT